MAELLALLAAVFWGSGDFIGGMTGKRHGAMQVAMASDLLTLPIMLILAPATHGTLNVADLAWGAGAGLGTVVGVSALFQALAIGPMNVVAPLTAVGTATLPALFGIVTGERPTALSLTGIALAIFTIVLVSSSEDPVHGVSTGGRVAISELVKRPGIRLAFLAVVSLSFTLICLDEASTTGGLWPLVTLRVAKVSVLGIYLLTRHRLPAPSKSFMKASASLGVCFLVGDVSFLVATQTGLLSIVTVLGSMYPVMTVILARTILKEHLSGRRAFGIACALLAVGLISLG